MAVNSVAVFGGILLASTPLAGWAGWRYWNRRMLEQAKREAKDMTDPEYNKDGQYRKFLLGSERFGFFYKSGAKSLKFFHKSADGSLTYLDAPVRNLTTATVVALMQGVVTAAQVPMYPPVKMDGFAQTVQTTVTEVETVLTSVQAAQAPQDPPASQA